MRLDPYEHEPEDLHGAIGRLLGDGALRGRLSRLSAELQGFRGAETAASRIELTAAEP